MLTRARGHLACSVYTNMLPVAFIAWLVVSNCLLKLSGRPYHVIVALDGCSVCYGRKYGSNSLFQVGLLSESPIVLGIQCTVQRNMEAAASSQADDAAAVRPNKRKHGLVNVGGDESFERQCDGSRTTGDAQEAVLIECMECLIMKELSSFSGKVRRSIYHHRSDSGAPSRRTSWVCKSCTSEKCSATVKRCSSCKSECVVGVNCSVTQANKPASIRFCFRCQEEAP